MSNNKNIIGIIGGMGPAATVDLMQRIIDATPADDDKDHFRVLVDNNSQIPSRIAALIDKTGESPAPMMIETALGLQKMGADVLAIPCNTAHFYHKEVADALSISVLNMIELSAKYIRQTKPSAKKIGLLASTAVQLTGLYEPYFEKYGINVVYPKPQDQEELMMLIKDIKSNQHQTKQLDEYYEIANRLSEVGADCLLVACTEFSIIDEKHKFKLPHFDALNILVEGITQTDF